MKSPVFGYHMPSFSFEVPPEQLFDHVAGLAGSAEEAGFDLVTVMDHFYQIGVVGPETEPMLEAYTLLGGIAARTRRIRLGTLVTGVTYRNPALLVKAVTTLDTISAGRAILGIGAAWNESEHIGLGFDFPRIGEREDRLEEALEIARLMFSEARPSFGGRYYRLERAINSPRPVQRPGIPILVGGDGERRTLRAAARYADITHWFPRPAEELQHKLEVFASHCAEAGREPSAVTKLLGAPPEVKVDTPVEEAAEMLHAYLEMGFAGFTFRNATYDTPEKLVRLGEIKRRLAA